METEQGDGQEQVSDGVKLLAWFAAAAVLIQVARWVLGLM